MIVTYQDELGVVSVQIDNTYGIQFDGYGNALFTDTDGKDYTIPMEHLICIAETDWFNAE